MAALGLVSLGQPWLRNASAQSTASDRVALVICNGAYPGSAALANPVHDADGMAAVLEQLGFSVVQLKDATKSQITEAIARTGVLLKGQKGVGLLYYAGHGMQVNARNHLLPVDARIASEDDVQDQTVDVAQAIAAFKQAGTRVNIVILDACRDNPFAGQSTGKGLAPVDAPTGTFLAYATAPGNVAEDGDEKSANGLYTGFLLKELARPEARIEDVFKRVRLGVRQASQGRQVPWESTSLEDDFYFDAQRRRRSDSREDEGLLKAERATWDRIREGARSEDLFAFLLVFPNGRYAEQANFLLNQRAAPQLRPAVAASGAQGSATPQSLGRPVASAAAFKPYYGPRFVAGDRYTLVRRDAYNQVEEARETTEVIGVSGLTLHCARDGMVTERNAMGARLSDGNFQYLDSLVELPAEYALGKRWGNVTRVITGDGQPGFIQCQVRVTGRETLVVEGRSYDSFVLSAVGQFVTDGSFPSRYVSTTWAMPEFGVPLRQIIERSMGSTRKSRTLFEIVALDIKR